ncbi:MAG: hypothetical protein EAZ81_08890 [Verrucomicrobia bacterium]|nr:MAG: hypothetical protein EAZ81_08890 [Verrucomicrobiota bacterium]
MLSSEQKRMYAESIKNFTYAFRKGRCLLCDGDSIRSHTISKSNYLKLIGEGGSVLQWRQNWWAKESDDLMGLGPVVINEASTFPGFCAEHDGRLFESIDTLQFSARRDQLFLQAFRAHVRELHCKRAQLSMVPEPSFIAMMHGLENPESYTHSDFALLQQEAMKAGLRDTILHHNNLESIRISDDFARMQHCVVTLESESGPFIASAGSFFPEILPDGTILQNFMDLSTPQETLHFSLLPHVTGSYAVMSFLDVESFSPRQLIEAVNNYHRAADLICWMAFAYLENTFLRPSWWNGLGASMKHAIRHAFDHNASLMSPESHTVDSMPPEFITGMRIQNIFWL